MGKCSNNCAVRLAPVGSLEFHNSFIWLLGLNLLSSNCNRGCLVPFIKIKLREGWVLCGSDGGRMASVAGAMQDSSTDINFVNFNQDCSSLAIGTRTGYKLLSLSSVDKLELIYESACRYLLVNLGPYVCKFILKWLLQGRHYCWKTFLLLPSCPCVSFLPSTAESLPLQKRCGLFVYHICYITQVWTSGTEICQYSYSNTILAVKLNRARLVVCLEEALYIHNIRDMKVKTA